MKIVLSEDGQKAGVYLPDGTIVAEIETRDHIGKPAVLVRMGDMKPGVPMHWTTAYAEAHGNPWLFAEMMRDDRSEAYDEGYEDGKSGGLPLRRP